MSNQRSLGMKDKTFRATSGGAEASKRCKPVDRSGASLSNTTDHGAAGRALQFNSEHQAAVVNRTMATMDGCYHVSTPSSLQLLPARLAHPYDIPSVPPYPFDPSIMSVLATVRATNNQATAMTGMNPTQYSWSQQQQQQQQWPSLRQRQQQQQWLEPQQQWLEPQQQQASAMLPDLSRHGLLFDVTGATSRLPLYQETPLPLPFTSSVSTTDSRSMISSVRSLPFCLSGPTDDEALSTFQVVLRQHVQAFAATADDMAAKTRGRNKKIHLNQVGLRCRHCAHVSAARRGKGSVYFPASILGFYQAAQNISAMHVQCGLCPEMPDSTKIMFAQLLVTKTANSSSKGRRSYWGHSVQTLGDLVDTDQGVFARSSVPVGVRLLAKDEQTYYQTK